MKSPTVCLFIVLCTLAARTEAGDPCCTQCGCPQPAQKTCRLVCDVTLVPKVEYACICEDFCLSGPSQQCGQVCTADCATPCSKHCRSIWKPSCAEVRTRNKLVKRIVLVEKPVYRWVVEDACCQCGQVSTPTAGPPAPLVASDHRQPEQPQGSLTSRELSSSTGGASQSDHAAQLHLDCQRW
jgi:hypothetical protein